MLKRIICIISVFIFIFASVTVKAEKRLNPEIEDIFRAKMTETQLTDIAKKFDVSVETVKEISENSIIITRYYSIFFGEAGKTIQQQIEKMKEYKNDYRIFMVVGDEIGILNAKKVVDGKETIEIYVEETLPTYVNDLLELEKNILFENEVYKIEDIEIFDARKSHLGTLVYLICDKGTLVKYYENAKTEAVWYKESEFQKLATEYDAYCKKTAYNEKGEPVNGGAPSFNDFIQNIEIYRDRIDNYPQENEDKKWVFFAIAGVGIIAGGAFFIFVVRKKRKS